MGELKGAYGGVYNWQGEVEFFWRGVLPLVWMFFECIL